MSASLQIRQQNTFRKIIFEWIYRKVYFAPDIYHNILHLAASMLKNQTPNLAYLNSNASKYSLPFEFQGLIYQNAKKNEKKKISSNQ